MFNPGAGNLLQSQLLLDGFHQTFPKLFLPAVHREHCRPRAPEDFQMPDLVLLKTQKTQPCEASQRLNCLLFNMILYTLVYT